MIYCWVYYNLALTAIFLKVVQCQPRLNRQTQPFWVKGVWIVSNSQSLAGFGIDPLRLVTVGSFDFDPPYFWDRSNMDSF